MSDFLPLCSTLELLPDELLVAIISYLHPVERYLSFGRLNISFSNILCEMGIGIDVQIPQQAKNLPDCIRPLLAFHVIFVRLRVFCPVLDLTSFRNVRSLILANLTLQQLTAISAKCMPHLIRLSVTTSAGSDLMLQNVLTNQFPALRVVYLPHSRWTEMGITCDIISSLCVGECLFMDFDQLLGSLPGLHYLETAITRCDLVFAKTPYSIHSSLRQLKLFIDDDANQDEVELIMYCAPELRHLTIHFNDWKDNEMDFFKLYDILKKYTPKLNYFKYFAWIRHFDNANSPTIPEIESVRKMSPLFTTTEFGLHETKRNVKYVRN